MSDLEPPANEELSEQERIDAIAARVVAAFDNIEENLPPEAKVTRAMMAEYAIQVDENNNTKLTKSQRNKVLIVSVSALERRIIDMENALIKAGLLPPRR